MIVVNTPFTGSINKSICDSGIKLLNEVPDGVKLNDKQKIQRLLAENGGVHKDEKQIKHFLDKLRYPIYYLDFETINPAVPKFDGMKPYQRIPFQFSLHIQEEEEGELKHISFLADGTSDPRPKFMQALKDNLGEVRKALKEMSQKGVIAHFKEEKLLAGRKMVDVKFVIVPSLSFVSDMVGANKRFAADKTEKICSFGSPKGFYPQ